MSISLRIPVFLTLALAASPASPQIDESTIKIEKIGPAVGPAEIRSPDGGGGISPLPILDQIINIGQKLWRIIEDNRPVSDVRVQYATALPKGVRGWADMSGWRPPEGTIYEMRAKNVYGADVIKVRYQVLRTYGGGYRGKGKYLTAVAVEPLLVEVAWGYRFSMEALVPDASVVNVGTSADPVAGMMAVLDWRISTALKDSQGQSLYFMQGDGAFKEVGGPFAGRSLEKAKTALATLGGTIPL